MDRGEYGVPLAACDCVDKCLAWKKQAACPAFMARTARITVEPCKKCNGPTRHKDGACISCT